ncbi:hypothetical protein NC652_018885 [Populus alba x Populus x berolinensis]|nr:hypothetical protein NC652_018885 [Populus alba x Populus x berolinensis]
MATGSASSSTFGNVNAPLPTSVINTLLHYASRSNDSFHMSHAEIKPISDVLRKCSSPCNFLVFGLTHETLLWKALNHNGRTVFIEENRYYAAYYEEPVQNLLFSECKLGLMTCLITVYEVDWDVILVDGPRGDGPDGPGRMTPIFTAGVSSQEQEG